MAIRQKTGGRRPGTPNKKTQSVREALQLAYRRIGGDRAFTKWARENPTLFYGLMAKLLPTELAISAEVEVTRDPMTDFDVARRIAFILARAGQQLPATVEAERVEALPAAETEPVELPEELPREPAEAPTYSIPPETFRLPDDISPTLENYHGSNAEQGATDRFSQHPRFMPRPTIRRRRDLA